ncbi:Mucin-19 [Streptomyces qinglanensis]|uniref:Mucin-19 n=1 Tax=Streptomyces qinglanensis TaxID=943816 RepID=UPI003D73AA71
MDAKQYNDGLTDLRSTREEIKKAEKAAKKAEKAVMDLHEQRDRQVQAVAAYDKAKAQRIGPAAGLTVKDVVELAPHLAPQPAVPPAHPATTATAAADTGAAAPTMPQVALQPTAQPATTPAPEEPEPTDQTAAATKSEAAAATSAAPALKGRAPDSAGEELNHQTVAQPRKLPAIPDGEAGDRWFTTTANLVSKRPNYTQQARPTVFLDTTTGDLVHRDQRVRLDLGHASAEEILTAVYAHVPDSIERIYITAGAPWHRDADRYPYLKDAVRSWLDAPMSSGWKVESTRGHDRAAGHFLHERNPVGRWEWGDRHVEIRSVAEWFDPDGADVATVRHAFALLWQTLKTDWPDVVLMGSPSQTGRDLWTRTIPAKPGAKWADGYPVMSDEIRQLLHATSGQGRTELITPPRVPTELPQLHELDRTLAYGKHTWASGVGAPQRVTARTFASWSQKQQTDALFAPSHWQVKVTIPDNWNHVGLLPFAVEGDRSWTYPHEAGRTFVTWAGGAELNLALRNPIAPWRIEILDGLLWESGTPLKEWSEKLKKAWAGLETAAAVSSTDHLRRAYKLASRGVRSILLYGIGGFAQRPTTTTGSLPLGEESQIPDGARITSMGTDTVTWERTQMSRNPNAHPEWAAGVWSAARAALLSTRAKTRDGQTTHVGALHLPAGSIIAFRTDAIYTSVMPDWPDNREPGDYRLKGTLDYPVTAPANDSEFYTLQSLGRALLQEKHNELG